MRVETPIVFRIILTKFHGLYVLVFHVIIFYFLGKRNEISLATVIKNEIELNVKQTMVQNVQKTQKIHKV